MRKSDDLKKIINIPDIGDLESLPIEPSRFEGFDSNGPHFCSINGIQRFNLIRYQEIVNVKTVIISSEQDLDDFNKLETILRKLNVYLGSKVPKQLGEEGMLVYYYRKGMHPKKFFEVYKPDLDFALEISMDILKAADQYIQAGYVFDERFILIEKHEVGATVQINHPWRALAIEKPRDIQDFLYELKGIIMSFLEDKDEPKPEDFDNNALLVAILKGMSESRQNNPHADSVEIMVPDELLKPQQKRYVYRACNSYDEFSKKVIADLDNNDREIDMVDMTLTLRLAQMARKPEMIKSPLIDQSGLTLLLMAAMRYPEWVKFARDLAAQLISSFGKEALSVRHEGLTCSVLEYSRELSKMDPDKTMERMLEEFISPSVSSVVKFSAATDTMNLSSEERQKFHFFRY